MKLSDLEKTLCREYDSKQISPAVRGMVMEYLRGHPSVQGEDAESIKVFTKVAKRVYLNDPESFDWSLVDRLLTYHEEGIEAGRREYQETQVRRFHILYVHLAGHAVEIIDKMCYSDQMVPAAVKERLFQRGLDLVALVQNEAREVEEVDNLIPTIEHGAKMAFGLYFETNDLKYAEQGYQALEQVCGLLSDPTALQFAVNTRSILTSKVLRKLKGDVKTERKDVVLWATRAYEAASDDLPLPSSKIANRILSRASAAEDLYNLTRNNTWKKRALRCYGKFLEYCGEHPEEQVSPGPERYARSFIKRESRR